MEVQYPMIAGICYALMGVTLAFFGYRLMRSMIRIQTAIVFAAAALEVGTSQGWSFYLTFGAALGAGVVGYLLGDAMYYLNIFLMGAVLGALAAFIAGLILNQEIGLLGIILGILAGGVLGGILAIVFQRPGGIVITSLMGSALIILGGFVLFTGKVPKDIDGWPFWATLAMAGVISSVAGIVQERTTRNLPAPSKSGGRNEKK